MRSLLTREHGVQHRRDDPLHLLPPAPRDAPARSGGEDEICGGADCLLGLGRRPPRSIFQCVQALRTKILGKYPKPHLNQVFHSDFTRQTASKI